MFSHSNYTIFMISMRVGTQGIPIYFKIFKGKYELIFTADRWFNS